MDLGVISLFVAIALMMLLAYKGVPVIPLTILCAIIVALCNGMGVWTALSESYVPGFAGIVQSYFFIFIASTIYAELMEKTGCAVAIGYKLIDWFGTKNAILVCILIVSVLTYGGISLFVVVFAAAPIMFTLYKEADLPRHLTLIPIVMGAATYTMSCLPGSPQLTNVIPSQYLGTPLTAAPVFSIAATVIMFAIQMVYVRYAEKKARAAGEHWSFPENYDISAFEAAKDRSALPSAGCAFAPIIVLIVIIIGASALKLPVAGNATLLTTIAMLVAFVVCLVLNYKRLSGPLGKNLAQIASKGSTSGITAMIGLGAVVGFGAVVSASPAYQSVLNWVYGLQMSPYIKGVVATSVISGVAGSSSGGARLCLSEMANYFISTGCNLDVLHRLIAIAAGTLDSLPHSSGIFLMLAYLGLTHKTAYKHSFALTVCCPTIVCIIMTVIATLIYV